MNFEQKLRIILLIFLIASTMSIAANVPLCPPPTTRILQPSMHVSEIETRLIPTVCSTNKFSEAIKKQAMETGGVVSV